MARVLSVRGLAQLVMVALPVAVGILIAHRAVDIPYWDEWEWADLIYKMHVGTLQFADVWAQHSEHRMLFPNLLMLGLARFGGWHPVREQFLSLGILVISQLVIVTMMRRSVHTVVGVLAAAAASILLYGLWQSENLGWGFQTGWFLCNACAILVAFLIARPNRRPIHVLLALIVAFIGSYSLSQGLIIWAVGIVAIILAPRKQALTLAVWVPAAILAYLVYRHGMYKVDTGHFDVLVHPLTTANYVLSYLGSPVARWSGSRGSAVAGLLVLIVVVGAFVSDLQSSNRVRRLLRAAPWYALAAYPLLCAIATATGRAGFGTDQALASRYTSVSSIIWIVAIALVAIRVSRLPQPMTQRQAVGLAVCVTTFVYAAGASDVQGWREWKASAATLASARSELIQSDSAALPKIYPVQGRVIMLIGELRTVHDGVFAAP